ncbi:MAG: glycosyltransferase family 2 protein [Candidatus Pacebacteria bacterium]|nr:glycosyltransferase family 2 protein [Candidatus Paceibacterota bacterium]MDD4201252.1 glycosyltransferase family 2 protein [Candidatus Paceibacterota bacterium]
MSQSFVSIIIPCRNEEKFISKCLDSFLKQNYPKDKMEILVIDGMSTDKTREIAREYSEKYPFIKLIDNKNKFTPFALNLGIKNSKGDIITIAGSHTKYDKDYILKCLKYLEEYKADNVGGILKTIPKKDTLIAKAIAFSLSSFFGAGNSAFRTGATKPKFVDTVFGGCYKKEVFNKIGLFNENLIRSQDMEFNMRLKRAGGKILLSPDIIAYYYPKDNLIDFFKHNFKDGFWAIYPLKFVKIPLKFRHYIPLIFILILSVSFIFHLLDFVFFTFLFQFTIVSYLLFSSFFSLKITTREKDLKYFSIMILVFAIRHFGYGIGSLWGVFKLIKEGPFERKEKAF